MTTDRSWTVVYRTGGIERCQWKRCLPVTKRVDADRQARDIETMGYKALVGLTHHWDNVGLPEGWDV